MKKFVIKNFMSCEVETLKREIQECKAKGKNKEKFVTRRLNKMQEIEDLKQELLTIELPKTIKISVVWNKSYAWGYCPTAELYTYNGWESEFVEKHASGCGYDKLSSVISYCFNDSKLIKAILLQNRSKLNRAIKHKGASTYGLNDNYIWSYGVGISCFKSIFEVLGYKWLEIYSKNAVAITITK